MSEKTGNAISQMQAFAQALAHIMEDDPRVMVMTADLVGSCGLSDIEARFSETQQFVNVGIAEQNMIGIAAGLAKEGMLPYAYTFSAFNAMRACEQIRTDVFYNGLNVKVIGTHCGVSTGQAGSTHFSLEDMGIIRSMPGSVLVVPSDPVAAAKTAQVCHAYRGGMYVRLDRNPLPALYTAADAFAPGRGHVLKDGDDIALFVVGAATHAALEAAQAIEQETGKGVAVIDIYSVKPLDVALVQRYTQKCAMAFAIEEHNTHCGLYGALAECVCRTGARGPLYPIGIPDEYPHGNTVERLRQRLGLDAEGIMQSVIKYSA